MQRLLLRDDFLSVGPLCRTKDLIPRSQREGRWSRDDCAGEFRPEDERKGGLVLIFPCHLEEIEEIGPRSMDVDENYSGVSRLIKWRKGWVRVCVKGREQTIRRSGIGIGNLGDLELLRALSLEAENGSEKVL